jgi:hypothetical protein
MSHTLKLIVSSLLAVLAGCAVASSALAAGAPTIKVPGHFSGASINGHQNGKHIFSFGGVRGLECEIATFSGSLASESSTTLTLVPVYEKCQTKPLLGISFPATVEMNKCDYLFHGEENASREFFGEFAANVDLDCPAGKEVVIDVEGAAKCSLTVEPFDGYLGNLVTKRGTFVQTLEATTNVSMTAAGSGGICASKGQTATYSGKTILEASSGGFPTSLEVVSGP